MAQRRMFSKAVVNSARFLRMPQTSRLLYYDLGMAADDDGIVEAFTVIRTTGAAEDDLRVLASRGFVTVLNEDLVSYITDWQQNNQLRRDRYTPSVYAELLVKLADGNQMATGGLPDGNQMEPQYRLGKDSIGKVSIEEWQTEKPTETQQNPAKPTETQSRADKPPRAPRFTPPTVEEVAAYCQERGNKVDPQRFTDFYAGKGWMVGKNKMRDWKACVRTWERDDKKEVRDITSPDRYTYQEGESL